MRPKFIVVLLLFCLAVGGVIHFSTSHKSPAAVIPVAAAPLVPSDAPTHPTASRSTALVATEAGLQPPRIDPDAMTPARAAFIQARMAELAKLGLRSDPESFATIRAELTNPEKLIRAEALEAAIQFGNRDIIPYLRELAAIAQEPLEKDELLEAADYLALPSLTEVRQQRKLQQAASGAPPQLQAPRTNPFGPSRLRATGQPFAQRP